MTLEDRAAAKLAERIIAALEEHERDVHSDPAPTAADPDCMRDIARRMIRAMLEDPPAPAPRPLS